MGRLELEVIHLAVPKIQRNPRGMAKSGDQKRNGQKNFFSITANAK
jgi:hypothetical protein